MANVIRQDVIEVGFETDLGGLKSLTSGLDDVKKSVIGTGKADGLEKIKEQAEKASNSTSELGDEAKKSQSTLKQMANVGVTKLTSGLQKVGTTLTNIAKKSAVAAYNSLKKLASLSFKGLIASATAIGALVGKSVSSYADYEQLVGGVDTLFKSNSKTVQKYADNAYKTAGLSANAYMETVTSFSASMINSVGGDTAKAAKLSDMAITDMADNANKMGTSMDSIIQTYQSLARGNTAMLDNLKLGYGGTKEELKRLLKDAEKLTGKKFDVSNFSDIVEAIHAVQTKMDITGTTAKEASGTISGSLASMKSAWGNLLPALIQGGDSFDRCIENLVSSVKTFGKNIMPALKSALSGVGDLVEELAPIIAEELPEIIKTVAPSLLKAGGTLIGILAKTLIDNAGTLAQSAKDLALEVVKAIYEGFTGKEMSGDTFSSIEKAIDKIVSVAKVAVPVIGGLVLAFKGFNKIKAGAAAVKKVANGIGSIASKVTGGLAPKISGVGDSIQKTGTKSKISSKNMLATAKSFMMLAAAVLMIAVSFGILAFSAIALANAGGAAIGVMAGLVVALAGLGFGMAMLLKTISSIGKKAIPAATAMLMLGGAIILIAVGFALLAHTAISLANAGGAAIGVMFGLIAVIALLAVGAAVLGTALTAGAVGFISFGVAVALVGAGFALVGVGAMLAATALSIIASVLPLLIMHSIQGTLSIIALGVSLTVFAIGATLAGVAALVLGAGLLVVAAALLVIATSLTICTVMLALMSALTSILVVNFAMMTAISMIANVMFVALSATLIILTATMTILTPIMLLFTTSLLALSVAMLALVPTTLLFTTTMTALMAIFLIVAPLALLFTTSMLLLSPIFALLSTSVPIFANALKPLPKLFTKLIVPTGLLVVALAPLAVAFAAVAVSAVALFVATAGLVGTVTILSALFIIITMTSKMLVVAFKNCAMGAIQLSQMLIPLITVLTTIISPLNTVTTCFAKFAVSAMIVATSVVIMSTMFNAMTNQTNALCQGMQMLMVIMNFVKMAVAQMTNSVQQQFNTMTKGVMLSLSKMYSALTETLRKMVLVIYRTNLANAGMQMINGLIRGMNSRKNAAISTARAIAQAINREYRKVQDINSPSGEWEKYGAYQIQGDINGMKKSMPKLQSTVQEVGSISIPYADSYTPENSTTSYSSSRNAEYNSYSPQFSFTISGTNDDRAMARKVKKWIAEAWEDMLDTMDSKTPQTQKV